MTEQPQQSTQPMTAARPTEYDETKRTIRKLFEDRQTLDYYDIITSMDVDLGLVAQICADLEQEGVIEVVK